MSMSIAFVPFLSLGPFERRDFHFSPSFQFVSPPFLLSYLHISLTSHLHLSHLPEPPKPFIHLDTQQEISFLSLMSPQLRNKNNNINNNNINYNDYATPNPSIAPCSFTTCPASEYEALQRSLTLLPAPRSTPCTRIVCVMPFCCEGPRERPDCGSSLRV
jgi:hypothetical protein